MESGNDDRFNENRFEDDDQENNENNNEGPNPINFLNQNIRNEFGQNNQDINSNFSGNKFDLGRGDPMKEEQEDINKINPFGNNNQDYFNSEQNVPNKNNPNPLNFQEPTKNPENSNQNDIQNNNEQIINPYPNLNEEKSINSEQIANKISNEDSNKNKNNENVVQGNSEQNKNHFSNISNSISGNINILGNNNEFNPNISLLQQKSLNNNSNNLLNNNINNNQNNPNLNQFNNEINNNNFNNPISNNNLDSFKNNQKGNNQISNINNEGNNSGIKAQIDKQNNNNLNNNQMHMINNNQMNMVNNSQMNMINNNQMKINNNQMNMINNNQMNINKNNQMNINNNQMNINKNNEMNKNNNQMNMINNQMNINNNQMNRNNNNQMNLNNNNPMNMNVMNNIGMQNQNLNKNININPPTYSFSNYKIAAKTGLKNFGDTSYLNSVLQILGTVRNISSYFLNPKNKATFEENVSLGKKFSFVIHRLFTHLYPLPEKIGEIYKPEALLNVLGDLNQVYSTTKSRNPNDLIYFCLDQLHRELNKYNVKFITKMNSTNKDKVIWTKLQDFQKSNNSIISNNFYWFEIKTKFCPLCNNNFYEFNNFETLELDISGAFNQYKSPFTLGQCLGFQRQKIQDSFCHVCQKYNKIQIYKSIYSSPIYFIFSLNRGNPDPNLLNIKFLIEENIDISQFLEYKKSYSKYELIGIVSISMKEKYKYVCFGKSPADKKWYLYNDEKVDDIDIGTVTYCNNNSDYVPCILLYQFKK